MQANSFFNQMKFFTMIASGKSFKKFISVLGFSIFIVHFINAQTANLNLDFTKPGASVSPMLYGLMTEEINHSYDGGLYAELIRNRIFKDNSMKPEGWSLVNEDTVNTKAVIK